MSGRPNTLPPSEKPQGLFEENHDDIPRPSLRLAESEVVDCETQLPLFTIATKAEHILCIPFGNPALTIAHIRTNKILGAIRFPKLSNSMIPLRINGRGLSLTHAPKHPYWELESTSFSDRRRKRTTKFWKRDEQNPRTVVLVDALKIGTTLARIDGDVLVFENDDLGHENMNEILVSAVALAEHARRRLGDSDLRDLGRSIGNIADEHRVSSRADHCASSRHGKLRNDRRASSRHGASSGGFAFAGFAAAGGGDGSGGGGGGGDGGGGGGGGGGCDDGGGGGGCC